MTTWRELEAEQERDLDHKTALAREVIARAFAAAERPALAFSGGKDSTVLLDLVRRFFPGYLAHLVVIYGNTGVEYPECVKFARWLAQEWRLDFHEARPGRTERPGLKYDAQRQVWEWLIACGRIGDVLKVDRKLKSTLALESACPAWMREKFERERLIWKAGTLKSYWWCTDQYGFPLLGKAWSRLKARRINIDTFLQFSLSRSANLKLLAYYDILRQVKISQACCDILKKEPAERVQADLGVDLILKGLMAEESRTRAINYMTRGHLFEGAKRDHLHGRPYFHCQPMATWTERDVWSYIRRYDVPYAPLYDMTYVALDGTRQHIRRNGCLGCATDIQYQNNHLQILRQTHRRAWRAVMRAGMAEQIRRLQRAQRNNGQLALFDAFETEELIEVQPCAFDDLDGTGGRAAPGDLVYDPEV